MAGPEQSTPPIVTVDAKPVPTRISIDEILERLVTSAREHATSATPQVAARFARVIELGEALRAELRELSGGSKPPPTGEQKR